jgi:hypothetical protein
MAISGGGRLRQRWLRSLDAINYESREVDFTINGTYTAFMDFAGFALSAVPTIQR